MKFFFTRGAYRLIASLGDTFLHISQILFFNSLIFNKKIREEEYLIKHLLPSHLFSL